MRRASGASLGRGRTAEAASAFDGAILCAHSLAQYGGQLIPVIYQSRYSMTPQRPVYEDGTTKAVLTASQAMRTRCDASVHAVPNHFLDNCDDEIYCHMVAGREMESVCENTTTADFKQSSFSNFLPNVRSGGPGRAAAAMAALAVMKLGTLLLRTLSKPIANRLKSQAAVHPKFRDFIISIAQVRFSLLSRISFPGQGSRRTKLLGGK
ncbi:OPA3-like protein [Hordeum vulgare]|nr:OPA3-like protein [Hordeum vulgare]